jgi:hypothetical protein
MKIVAVGLLTVGLAVPAVLAQKGGGIKDIAGETCGDHGTNVHFEKTPKDAAKRAEKEEKLVMVLHISGLFEDPDYT